jgi:hypothetical protein
MPTTEKSEGTDRLPTNGARCSPLTGQMVVMSYVHTYIDVMTITFVNDGLWTEGITSRRTRHRDRPDVHGAKLTWRFYRRRAGASLVSSTNSTQFLREQPISRVVA